MPANPDSEEDPDPSQETQSIVPPYLMELGCKVKSQPSQPTSNNQTNFAAFQSEQINDCPKDAEALDDEIEGFSVITDQDCLQFPKAFQNSDQLIDYLVNIFKNSGAQKLKPRDRYRFSKVLAKEMIPRELLFFVFSVMSDSYTTKDSSTQTQNYAKSIAYYQNHYDFSLSRFEPFIERYRNPELQKQLKESSVNSGFDSRVGEFSLTNNELLLLACVSVGKIVESNRIYYVNKVFQKMFPICLAVFVNLQESLQELFLDNSPLKNTFQKIYVDNYEVKLKNSKNSLKEIFKINLRLISEAFFKKGCYYLLTKLYEKPKNLATTGKTNKISDYHPGNMKEVFERLEKFLTKEDQEIGKIVFQGQQKEALQPTEVMDLYTDMIFSGYINPANRPETPNRKNMPQRPAQKASTSRTYAGLYQSKGVVRERGGKLFPNQTKTKPSGPAQPVIPDFHKRVTEVLYLYLLLPDSYLDYLLCRRLQNIKSGKSGDTQAGIEKNTQNNDDLALSTIIVNPELTSTAAYRNALEKFKGEGKLKNLLYSLLEVPISSLIEDHLLSRVLKVEDFVFENK